MSIRVGTTATTAAATSNAINKDSCKVSPRYRHADIEQLIGNQLQETISNP